MRVQELLVDYPVTFQTPVAWGEMDSFNHVNNVVYFRYFESARIAYFGRVGIDKHMLETRVGPILASTNCRFRRPLSYPDTITIGARVTEVGDDRFTMHYRVVSHTLEAVAAEGEGLIVIYDYENACKAPLPETIRANIEALDRATATD